MKGNFSQEALIILFKRMCPQVKQSGVVGISNITHYSWDIIFSMAFVKTCSPNLEGNVCSMFPPAERLLTLRKVSRDPFSMNSVMIITGLPTEADNKAVVSGAELQGTKTATIKRPGQRNSGVHSCDQPPSLTVSWG